MSSWAGTVWADLPLARPVPSLLPFPNTAPEPDSAYSVQDAFPGLRFNEVVAMATPPGETNRLFVVERDGLIKVLPDLDSPSAEPFLDLRSLVDSSYLEPGCLGLAFHPHYATNGYFYVYYTGQTNSAAGAGLHDILARFSVSPTNANRAEVASLTPLISQFDEHPSHNAGTIAFGPDGYLYYSVGDGGSMSLGNNQRIDRDFFAGIFRIDVDQRPENLEPNPHPAVQGGYRVPLDNPFLGVTNFNGIAVNPAQIRTEFYAMGLRNPWKFGFDPFTGELACGDVGHELHEEFNFIQAGGNYGYPYREGNADGPALLYETAPPGFTSLGPALTFHRQSGPAEFRAASITYGFVYRGTRFPHLVGKHILGDFSLYNTWAAWRDPTGDMQIEYIGPWSFWLATMGEDPRNGDILFGRAYHESQPLTRLVAAPPPSPDRTLPPTLADTGIFTDIENLVPADGVIPYEINVPFWSDNAIKRRWFHAPSTSASFRVETDGNLHFPEGSLWVKHFDLPLVPGDSNSLVRVETRVLVQSSNSVYGLTYRYGGATTNATLVSPYGLVENLVAEVGGHSVTQRWYYPSRTDCLRCHHAASGHALGFQPPQLNRLAGLTGGGTTNQLSWLASMGFLENPEAASPQGLRLAHPSETNVTLEHRARSLLHANCSSCHLPGGPTPALWDARITTPLDQSGLLAAHAPDPSLIVPGNPDGSRLLERMTSTDSRMPPLGSFLMDTGSVAVLSSWIASLSGYQSYAAWAMDVWGTNADSESAPQEDPDHDYATNHDEYLAGSNPLEPDGSSRLSLAIQTGTLHPEVTWTRPAGAKTLLECSDHLGHESLWSPVAHPSNEPVPLAVTTRYTLDANGPATSRFFRVKTLAR